MSEYAERPRLWEFMAFVRSMRCRAHDLGGCDGPIVAHHAGDRGLSHKADDSTCIPLCDGHHKAWHDAQPPFRGWSKEQREQWSVAAMAATQAAWSARQRSLEMF